MQNGLEDDLNLPPDLRTAGAECFLHLLRKTLRLQQIELSKPFTRLGGDSISAIRISAGLREHGYDLSPARLLTAPSAAALARSIEASQSTCDRGGTSAKIEGEVPLSLMQTRFFGLGLRNPHHYNQSLMLMPCSEAKHLDAESLRRCLVRLAEHHDLLRASSLAQSGLDASLDHNSVLSPAKPRFPADRPFADFTEHSAASAGCESCLSNSADGQARRGRETLTASSRRFVQRQEQHELLRHGAEGRLLRRCALVRPEELGDICDRLQQSLELNEGPIMAGAVVHMSQSRWDQCRL